MKANMRLSLSLAHSRSDSDRLWWSSHMVVRRYGDLAVDKCGRSTYDISLLRQEEIYF
eukprot:m.268961 g.268961  ORF g.268961 m.268961 type:complete len:58 (-) comp75967_c0_seq1:73-246(-)